MIAYDSGYGTLIDRSKVYIVPYVPSRILMRRLYTIALIGNWTGVFALLRVGCIVKEYISSLFVNVVLSALA